MVLAGSLRNAFRVCVNGKSGKPLLFARMVGSVSKRLSVIFLLLRIEGEWLFLAPPLFANIRFFFGFPIYFEMKNTIIFITADYFVFMCNNWRVSKVICFFCFCLSSPSIFPLNRNHGDFKRSQKKGERLTKSRSPLFVGSAWSTVVDYLTTILRAALLPLFMMSLTIYTPASVGR